MRRLGVIVLLLTLSLLPVDTQEQLTRDQRNSDLTQLASLYAKNVGPYEWKRDVQGFDLLRPTPWLQRVAHSDDLDFKEALIEYVASLNDAHDFIALPTTFSASLGMTVDIYDGKVLIDSINRTRLPVAQLPFGIGDELVSIDGRAVFELIESFRKYAIAANPRYTDRTAAARSRSGRAGQRRREAGHRRNQHLHDPVVEDRDCDPIAGPRCRAPFEVTGGCSSRPMDARARRSVRGWTRGRRGGDNLLGRVDQGRLAE